MVAAGEVVASGWGGTDFQGKGQLFREGAVPSSEMGSVLCPGKVGLGRRGFIQGLAGLMGDADTSFLLGNS